MDWRWLEWTNILQIPPLVLWGWWCHNEGSKCGGQTTQPLCSVTGQKLGPFIANHCGVNLMGAGLSAEDLGFESPLCRYQTTQPLCSVTWHKFGPLIANSLLCYPYRRWSVSGGFGVRVPTVSVPTSKVAGRRNGWAASGPCRGGLLWELSQGRLVASLYAVHSLGMCSV